MNMISANGSGEPFITTSNFPASLASTRIPAKPLLRITYFGETLMNTLGVLWLSVRRVEHSALALAGDMVVGLLCCAFHKTRHGLVKAKR